MIDILKEIFLFGCGVYLGSVGLSWIWTDMAKSYILKKVKEAGIDPDEVGFMEKVKRYFNYHKKNLIPFKNIEIAREEFRQRKQIAEVVIEDLSTPTFYDDPEEVLHMLEHMSFNPFNGVGPNITVENIEMGEIFDGFVEPGLNVHIRMFVVGQPPIEPIEVPFEIVDKPFEEMTPEEKIAYLSRQREIITEGQPALEEKPVAEEEKRQGL